MARRITNHNGRSGKDGTYSAKHNDRNFDTDHAKHIDETKSVGNAYWQRYKDEPSFEENEKRFYEEHFKEGLEARNQRYKDKGKKEQIKTLDEYREAFKSAPEETLYYIGDKDQNVDPKELMAVFNAFNKWHRATYPQCVTLDIALHVDEEGAPHIHQRKVWLARDKFGFEEVNQSKALEDMGIQRPNLEEPKSRYNNAKMTYTKDCREKLIELCIERGINVEIEPQEASKVGKTMLEYQTEQQKEQLAEIEQKLVNTHEVIDQLEAKAQAKQETLKELDSKIEDKQTEIEALELKAIRTKAEIEAQEIPKVHKKLFSKREYVEVDPQEYRALTRTATKVENVLDRENDVHNREINVAMQRENLRVQLNAAMLDREAAASERAQAERYKASEESYILGTAEKMVKDEIADLRADYQSRERSLEAKVEQKLDNLERKYHKQDDRLNDFLDYMKDNYNTATIEKAWKGFKEWEREQEYEWEYSR